MTDAEADAFLGRRYLKKGFLDDALRMFMQHPTYFTPADWTSLRDCLLVRGRITDVIDICKVAGIPIPRDELLSMGDEYLRRTDVERAITFYEIAAADQARWERVIDHLIQRPDRYQQARSIAVRHLSGHAARQTERPRVVKLAK